MIRSHNLLSGVASAVGPFSRGRLWAAHGAYGGFSLASLFAASEQGVWYDPSDLTSMYQDSAGTTAAAVGQPVGLMLDKSQGLVRGPELVTNGGFDTDTTGYTTAGSQVSQSVVGGRLKLEAVSGSSNFFTTQSVTTVAGRWYEVSTSIESSRGTFARLRVTGIVGPANIDILPDTAGVPVTKPLRIQASGTSLTIQPGVGNTAAWGAPGDVAFFDNISVREIPGNHATQATTASKPILARHPVGGRRNLLTYTEQFDDAIWTKGSATVTAAGEYDGRAVWKTTPTAANGAVFYASGATFGANAYTWKTRVKADGITTVRYRLVARTTANAFISSMQMDVDLSAGTHSGATGGSFANTSFGITDAGGGYYDIVMTGTAPANTAIFWAYVEHVGGQGDSAKSYLINGSQLETGSTATAYQRVGSQYNVTEAGKSDLWHLAFDGFDDGMATGSINFTSTDEMTVIAGVRKLDSGAGEIVDTNYTSSSGSMFLRNGTTAGTGPAYTAAARGGASPTSSLAAETPASYAAPVTSVLTALHDISANSTVLRVDGSQQAIATGSKGGGNFSTNPIYIGRRGGSSLPFNGHLYGLVVRGALTAGDTLTKAEDAMNAKTGAY